MVHKNDKLRLKLNFTNGYTNEPGFREGNLTKTETADETNDDVLAKTFFEYFKIVDSQISQEIAGIPMLTITFTR